MASLGTRRLGESVLLSLVLTVGLTSAAFGASRTNPPPGQSVSSTVAAQAVSPAVATYYITGTVTKTGGKPLPNILVQADSPPYYNSWTASDGTYSVAVPSGTYTVYFSDPSGKYLHGYYSKGGFTVAESSATPVTIVSSDATGINAQMQTGYYITGTVTGTGGTPLPNMQVQTISSDYWDHGMTASDGTYSLHVASGTYKVWLYDQSGTYLTGYYSSSGFTIDQGSATSVPVNSSNVSGIDVQMQTGHYITGTVTGTGGAPLPNIQVQAISSDYYAPDATASDGTYSVAVPSGTYTVSFYDPSGTYPNGYYSSGGFTLDQGSAAPVPVSTLDVTGINVQMVPWSVTLEASATKVPAGTSVTLTAGTNQDVGLTPIYLVILAGDNSAKASCKSGTTCTATVTSSVAGSQTYTAVVGTSTGASPQATSGPVTVTWTGPAVALALSGFPSPAVAGVSHNITVTAKDAHNNTATDYRGTVHVTSSDGAAVLPANYKFTAADAGTHVFSVTLRTAGTQSVTATDTGNSSITGIQSGIVVTPAAATTLAVSGIPSPTVAGTAHNVTVTARDAHGNTATAYSGTVHFTSSDGAVVLPANATLSAGVGTFSVTLKTAGTQSVTATDTATASITGVQSGIVVTPAGATTLVVSGFPSPTVSGVAGSVTVTAKDAHGNTATAYTGTVHFSSSDGAAVLPANATLAAGVGTFSVTLETAGTQSVTATDTATASITGVQSGIVVNAAAVKTLVVSGLSSPRTAGSTGSIRVTAVDAYGNRVSSYRGTVHFTSSDPQAKLPANYTFTATDAGTHVFSGVVILKTAGTQSVTATDTLTKTIKGSQTGIVVKPAAVKTLVVSGLSSPRTAGSTGNIRVSAVDAYGNRVSSYRGTVHFTSSDAKAKLPANYKFTATDNGTHVFSGTVILKTAGTQSVTATDTLTKTIKGSQTGIVVKPAAVKTLVVSGLSSPRTAGSTGNIRVSAVDAYGNRVSSYRGTVHFTSSDAKAKLPANYKFTATDNGTHVFSGTVILKTAGTQSVTATDTLTKTIKGSQAGIVVKAAAVKTLVVSGLTTPRTKGVAGTIRVTAIDAYGNRVSGYTGTIHFTSSDAKAVLPANYKFKAADAGTHVFTVTLKTAGTQSVTATDTLTKTIKGSQTGIVVKS